MDDQNSQPNKYTRQGIPIEIAQQHANMAEVAMAVHGNRDMAHRAIDRAFELYEEMELEVVTLDSHISSITSVRVATILQQNRIETVGDLASFSIDEVASFRNLGLVQAENLELALASHGFEFM